MTIDIDDIERLARAATPGPWRLGDWSARFGTLEDMRNATRIERNLTHAGPEPYVCGRADGRYEVVSLVDPPAIESDHVRANVAYICVANPSAVLELIAEVRRLTHALALGR